jgi:hypothetical protein
MNYKTCYDQIILSAFTEYPGAIDLIAWGNYFIKSIHFRKYWNADLSAGSNNYEGIFPEIRKMAEIVMGDEFITPSDYKLLICIINKTTRWHQIWEFWMKS